MNFSLKNESPQPVAPIVPPELPSSPYEAKEDPPTPIKKFNYWWLLRGLGIAFLGFYLLADWTEITTAQLNPGQMIFNNRMTQLWMAAHRLVFVLMIALLVFAILNRYLDLLSSIKNDLSPPQRVWLAYAIVFALCFLYVLLLMVKLPESVSVGR